MKLWIVMVALFTILVVTPASSQKLYTMHQIIHAADSCLRSYVGDTLFPYFHRRELMEYSIADSVAGSWYGFMTDTSNAIYGRLIFVGVDYYYYFTYTKCPQLPQFNGDTHITLDSNFNQTNRLWFGFLPERILKNLPCNFISEAEAVAIAEKAGLEAGPAPIVSMLWYHPEVKDYVWRVSRAVKLESGEVATDVVLINAVSATHLLHQKYLPPPPIIEDFGSP